METSLSGRKEGKKKKKKGKVYVFVSRTRGQKKKNKGKFYLPDDTVQIRKCLGKKRKEEKEERKG